MKKLALLKIAIVSTLFISISAFADPPRVLRGCALYWDANFSGGRYDIGPNQEIANIGKPWADEASSIAVAHGCWLHVYKHENFGGDANTFSSDTIYVGDGLNDEITSVRCFCR